MAKYRRIPIEIEAVKWTGQNYDEIKEFADGNCYQYNGCLFITTANGTKNVNGGEYIVKTGPEEFKAVSDDIFNKTYELVKSI